MRREINLSADLVQGRGAIPNQLRALFISGGTLQLQVVEMGGKGVAEPEARTILCRPSRDAWSKAWNDGTNITWNGRGTLYFVLRRSKRRLPGYPLSPRPSSAGRSPEVRLGNCGVRSEQPSRVFLAATATFATLFR